MKQLRTIPAFGNLKKSDLEAISRTFRSRRFGKDCPIVVQDCDIGYIGLILKGSARVFIRDQSGKEQQCGHLSVGDFIIDISLFVDHTAIASIVSREPLICLFQERSDFLEMLENFPSLRGFYFSAAMHNIWQSYRMIYGHDAMDVKRSIVSDRIPKNIINAMLIIDQLYSNPLTLDYLARESGMSRYHLSRLFKRHMGCSFKEYLNHKRIEAAKNLMQNQGMNVTEACFRVGYNDVSYFSRIFKDLEGVPPSTFRKNLKI